MCGYSPIYVGLQFYCCEKNLTIWLGFLKQNCVLRFFLNKHSNFICFHKRLYTISFRYQQIPFQPNSVIQNTLQKQWFLMPDNCFVYFSTHTKQKWRNTTTWKSRVHPKHFHLLSCHSYKYQCILLGFYAIKKYKVLVTLDFIQGSRSKRDLNQMYTRRFRLSSVKYPETVFLPLRWLDLITLAHDGNWSAIHTSCWIEMF